MANPSCSRPRLIGTAGPSCSGKTSVARAVTDLTPEWVPVIVPLDMYYRDVTHLEFSERAKLNFDHPDALEWPLIRDHLSALARGEAVQMPLYDYATHARTADRRTVNPGGLVIVEGLFALHDAEVRTLYDASAFMDVAESVALARREERDVRERDRTPEYTRLQFAEVVWPMAVAHVLPTREFADLVLDGTVPPEVNARAIVNRLKG
ncbi:MAG: uridine kinase [bacterium]|nr:uridine kinase [bacterium]